MRNVFVSYSHRLDQSAADKFRDKFSIDEGVFSDRSLEDKDIGHLTDDTIKNKYIKPRIKNSSVTIILIGKETGGRWWCDWEIYYSLLKTTNNDRNVLLGILLPNKQHHIPARLEKNKHMGKIIDMPSNYRELEDEIEEVYGLRDGQPNLRDDLRQRNSYIYY